MNNAETCLCGNNKLELTSREGYIVGSDGNCELGQIPLGKCKACGIIRQVDLPFSTEKEYDNFYSENYPPTKEGYISNSYDSDIKTAEKYFVRLCLSDAKKVLDVGCGSGALVDVCNRNGVEAYGCELGKYNHSPNNPNIYFKKFEDIHFPTDSFDKIICNDVIEHVMDPVRFLKEVHRVLDVAGIGMIEIPHFFHPNGKGHWKRTEHVWYYSAEQFEKILQKAGFINITVTERLFKRDAKLLFSAQKPKEQRTTILFPPGMGDAMWVMMKLQSFIKKNNIKGPVDAHIVCPKDRKYDGHKRSVPYLEMFPFVKSTGIVHQFDRSNKEHQRLWRKAYSKSDDTIFKDVMGCDYFLSYNGYTIAYRTLEKSDEYDCNWHPPMFVSLEQERYRKESIDLYGKYFLLYFPLYGMYKSWNDKLPKEKLAEAMTRVADYTGMTPIIVGKEWDRDDVNCGRFRSLMESAVDLTGKTTTEQIFGLIRGSQGMIAYPCGLPMMAAVLKQKVLMLWDEYWETQGHNDFAMKFAKTCCPPSVTGKAYQIEMMENLTVEKLIKSSVRLLTGKEWDAKKIQKQRRVKRGVALPKPTPLPSNKSGGSLAVVCVLKSGGDFNPEYVKKLKNMVARNTTIQHEFICLTDINLNIEGVNAVALKHGQYDRWWSKIELFRNNIATADRIIYFDLDTIITGNIDHILGCNGYDFIGLEPWNIKNRKNGMCASGLMSWVNDGRFSYIYNEFSADKISLYSRGDQEYVSRALAKQGIKPGFFQRLASGIYSYKRQCRQELPEDAAVVCFHGKPRPRDVNKEWVRDNWK